MNKIKPLDRQSLIDVALQTSGSVEGALGMSIKNDIPVSGELAPDVELETARWSINWFSGVTRRGASARRPTFRRRTWRVCPTGVSVLWELKLIL